MILPVSPAASPPALPGLDGRRLVRLMTAAIERCQLDLAGQVVLTEAATGAYAVTPVLAALAGAQVCALAAATRLCHGTGTGHRDRGPGPAGRGG